MAKGRDEPYELKYWENGDVMVEAGRRQCPKGNKGRPRASWVFELYF